MTQSGSLRVVDVRPARDGAAGSRRPTIEANFADGRANPNTVRVSVDGLNVTNDTSRSPSGIVYNPPSDLQSGRHQVRVEGTDMNGTPFRSPADFRVRRWAGRGPALRGYSDQIVRSIQAIERATISG
jgi:hypothetical protein